MFEPDDLRRTGIASARSGADHGALPLRARSSGPGQPTSAARIRHCPTPSSCSTPPAPRRNAQLLPSGRSLTNVDGFFGQFAGKADGVELLSDGADIKTLCHRVVNTIGCPALQPFTQLPRTARLWQRNLEILRQTMFNHGAVYIVAHPLQLSLRPF